MTAVGWHVGSLAGPDATAADMLLVLSNLTGLRIRGEYINGPDREGLDNVLLAVPEPASASLVLLAMAALPLVRRRR